MIHRVKRGSKPMLASVVSLLLILSGSAVANATQDDEYESDAVVTEEVSGEATSEPESTSVEESAKDDDMSLEGGMQPSGRNARAAGASTPQSAPITTPSIHSLRYSTINTSYKGVVVDVYLQDFSDATSFRAIIHRADGSTAVRDGAVDTLAHINAGGNKALTVPFNFAGSSAGSWFGGQNSIWTAATAPVGVTIEVMTDSHGLVTLTTPGSQALVERNGLYDDLRPTYLPSTTLVVEGAEDGLVGQTFTVSGDAYAALGLNRVYVQLVHRETSTRYGGTTINLLPEGTSAHWSRTYKASDNLPEGTYAAHVAVVARDGSVANVGWTDNFVLDNTMPTFAITTPPNGSVVRGIQRISATITDASDITKVLMNVGDGRGNYVWEKDKASNVTRDGDIFYLDVDTTTLPNGVNFVTLRATDGAGNTRYYNNNANTRQHSYIVDNEAPTAQIIAPDIVKGNPEIRGVASDNHEIRSHWFEVKAPNGSLYYKNFPSTSSTEVSFYLADVVGTVVEGNYVIRYVVTDKAGNRNDDPNYTNSEVHTVVVDNTKAQVEITSPDNGIHANGAVTIEASATDNAGLKSIVANVYNETNSTLLRSLGSKAVNGLVDTATWTFPDNLPDGTYTVRVGVTDQAGNSVSVTTVKFTVDRLAPTVAVNLARSGYATSGDSVKSSDKPEIEAFDLNLERIEVWKDGDKVTQWTNVQQGTVTYKGISWLGDGTYTVRAVDVAGNVSEFSIVIDSTEIPATPPADEGNPSSTRPSDSSGGSDETSHEEDSDDTTETEEPADNAGEAGDTPKA